MRRRVPEAHDGVLHELGGEERVQDAVQRVEGVGHAVVDGKGRGREAVDDNEGASLGNDGVDALALFAIVEYNRLLARDGHQALANFDFARSNKRQVRAARARQDQVIGGSKMSRPASVERWAKVALSMLRLWGTETTAEKPVVLPFMDAVSP